jgi:hypothetical protein
MMAQNLSLVLPNRLLTFNTPLTTTELGSSLRQLPVTLLQTANNPVPAMALLQ